MAPPLLTLQDIRISFGSKPLLDGAELFVNPRDRICLVGRNGSGKSTLLKIAAGMVEPDGGERFIDPSVSVRYLKQDADFTGFTTTRAYVEAGLNPTDEPYLAQIALEDVGLTGDEDTATISGGEARRAALAAALVAQPDVLLLDEPTNHLDLPAIEWLEKTLGALKSAIVLISHDRRFLETLSDKTVWIDRGQARALDQGFGAFEDWRDETYEQAQLEQHKLERKIARETEWLHGGGITGRRKRNVKRTADLQTMRQQKQDFDGKPGAVKMTTSDAAVSGKMVVEAKRMSKMYGDRTIVDDFSIRIQRGDRIGIVGPNGAGKTTLLNLLMDTLAPDTGTLRHGANVDIVVLDQKRDELDPTWTLGEAMSAGRGDQVVINGRARHVGSYMADFLFLPEQIRSPLSVLSGGEKARVVLARALAKPSNVLVLDEPTNDLDLETLDLLQEMLADYPGTILLVSHDRDFLDRVVTSVVASEGDGRWIEYAGGYTDMLAQRRGRDAQRPDAFEITQDEKAPAASPLATARGGPKPNAKPTAAANSASGKLSFKDKHALETLPGDMEKLQASIRAMQTDLSAADLYTRDPAKFERLTQDLGTAEAKLAAAEERWLELEMLRESLS